MKDYLGNEITAGMTVKIIRTKSFFAGAQRLEWINGEFVKVGEPIPDDPVWECLYEFPIIENDGRLYYVHHDNGGSVSMFLEHLDFGWQPTDLITIKGISDIKAENANY